MKKPKLDFYIIEIVSNSGTFFQFLKELILQYVDGWVVGVASNLITVYNDIS